MRVRTFAAVILVQAALLSAAPLATSFAGPFEDGVAEYERRDYAEALRLSRPLAHQVLQVLPMLRPPYDAPRLAATTRLSGDTRTLLHWAAIAAEVPKISDHAMEGSVVLAIVDEEDGWARKSEICRGFNCAR